MDLLNTLFTHTLSFVLRHAPHFSVNTLSRTSEQSPSIPHTAWQPSDRLKAEEWPEENLTSTADEGGGFYPMRLGEVLDDGRFVITRKLGWGGFSTVWLARDREYVLENTGPSRQITDSSKQSRSTRCHQGPISLRIKGNRGRTSWRTRNSSKGDGCITPSSRVQTRHPSPARVHIREFRWQTHLLRHRPAQL